MSNAGGYHKMIHLHHLFRSAIQKEKHVLVAYCVIIFNHYAWQLFALCGFQFLADRCPNHKKLSRHVVAAGNTIISEIPEVQKKKKKKLPPPPIWERSTSGKGKEVSKKKKSCSFYVVMYREEFYLPGWLIQTEIAFHLVWKPDRI